jgi:hypothetical protein
LPLPHPGHTDGMQWPWARETSTSRYTHHDRYVHARGAISPGGSPRARLVLHGHRCSSTVVLTHTYGARVPSGRHNISRLPKTSCRARSSLMGDRFAIHVRLAAARAPVASRPRCFSPGCGVFGKHKYVAHDDPGRGRACVQQEQRHFSFSFSSSLSSSLLHGVKGFLAAGLCWLA